MQVACRDWWGFYLQCFHRELLVKDVAVAAFQHGIHDRAVRAVCMDRWGLQGFLWEQLVTEVDCTKLQQAHLTADGIRCLMVGNQCEGTKLVSI